MTEARTITLDGIRYDVEQFSEGVQQAVSIYNTFSAQLQVEQLAVLKTQSALQGLGVQITAAVRKELEEKKAAIEKAGEDQVAAAPSAA